MEIPVDLETGEILPVVEMVTIDKLPCIIVDLSDVSLFYSNPQGLVDKINIQAGNPVFDMTTKKGRDECKSDAAKIIRCISPAEKESKRLDADYAKKIKQGLNFRKDFESGVRKIAALHRKPLTEWEENEEELRQELERRENRRLEAEKLLQDHQDAIDLDELYTHRKERELAEQIAESERKAIEDKRLFDEAVIKQAEEMRLQIEAEATRKAEAEQAKKLEQERAVIHEEEAKKARAEANVTEVLRLQIKAEQDQKLNEAMAKKRDEIATANGVVVMSTVEKTFAETTKDSREGYANQARSIQESSFSDKDEIYVEQHEKNLKSAEGAFKVNGPLASLNRPWEAQTEESFYDDIMDCEPTVFKDGLETITILKSEYDELKSRSERLFELWEAIKEAFLQAE